MSWSAPCVASVRKASVAVVASGFVVFVQFALFLVLGLALWKWFGVHPAEASVARGDEAFPQFIVQRLSKIPGAVGVILGAIFAVSMSTLSSSLNASAAALVNDFLQPTVGRAWDDRATLRATKLATLLFAVVQAACGLAGDGIAGSVVDAVLQIASFTTGVTLGLFFLARIAPRASGRAAFAAAWVGLALLVVLWTCTPLAGLWYSCVGAGATCLVGVALAPLLRS
jgi:Na+/proline symporter